MSIINFNDSEAVSMLEQIRNYGIRKGYDAVERLCGQVLREFRCPSRETFVFEKRSDRRTVRGVLSLAFRDWRQFRRKGCDPVAEKYCWTEPPISDHSSMHGQPGESKPSEYVTQPYQVSLKDLRDLVAYCDRNNLDCSIDPGASWHFPGRTLLISICRKGNDGFIHKFRATRSERSLADLDSYRHAAPHWNMK